VLGEFRKGVSRLLDPAALEACVERDIAALGPQTADVVPRYVGFVDAATGGGSDRFAAAVAHWERVGAVAVLDRVWAWAPPFDPNRAIAEAADLLKGYRIREVAGDRFAGGSEGRFVESAFRSNGIMYNVSELDRSAIYLELVPLVNSATCRLVNDEET